MQEPIRSLEGYHALVPSRSSSRPQRKASRRFSMEHATEESEEEDTRQHASERSDDLRVSPPLEDEVGGRIDITA